MSEMLFMLRGLGFVFLDSTQSLVPIAAFFLLFQLLYLKLPREKVFYVTQGLVLCLIGLTLFLFGVEYGFLPAGQALGLALGGLPANWVMIPVGFVIGFIATMAEPAVRILAYQVDKTSSGNIREKLVLYVLAMGVALAVALGMARVIYGFSLLYLVIPGYLLILAGMKYTAFGFAGMAFDSGGVVTGPMITTFVVAITLGAAEAIEGRDPVIDGFGLIALVAMVPILAIMALGIIYARNNSESGGA